MSSINFNALQNTSLNEEKYTFTDFHLDFAEDPIGSAANYAETVENGRDIKVAYDLNAIRNSLKNLFNTVPGERFLLPEYGSDVRRHVFEPVTESTSRRIGRAISIAISKWEPRIRLLNLDITGFADQNEYQIIIELAVPFLTEPIGLQGILTRDGYLF